MFDEFKEHIIKEFEEKEDGMSVVKEWIALQDEGIRTVEEVVGEKSMRSLGQCRRY